MGVAGLGTAVSKVPPGLKKPCAARSALETVLRYVTVPPK